MIRSKTQLFTAACLVLAASLVFAGCLAPDSGASGKPAASAVPAPESAQVTGQTEPPVSPSGATKSSTGLNDPASIASRFDEMRAMQDVQVLAQPRFMGRHSGTSGETLGAQYLADQFQKAGLEPSGENGTFIQEFPMEVTEFSATPELNLVGQNGSEQSLQLRDDFRPLIGGPAGPGSAQGAGVFAGTGDFRGVDVRDKIALVVPRFRLNALISNARSAGAVALILATGEQPILKGENGQPNTDNTLPVFLVSRSGVEALLQGSGHSREELNSQLRAGQSPSPFPLAFALRLDSQVETYPIVAKNVIGLLPAASPTGNSCIVGAHYEEIGPDPDGVVYPAANDNASGTAVVLEMARTVASLSAPLKANVLFIGWSGHEEGLLGSEYYVKHPVLPLDETECYINLDTVGQGSGRELLAGAASNRMRDAIEESVKQLEALAGTRPPVQVSRESSGASDHLNLEQQGVDSIDINWSGIMEGGNIHVPEDDASNVDAAKLKVTGQVATTTLLNLVGGPK